MSDLEPNTRAENFWVNEGDLEPITRKEQYIKHLYDETQVIPEYPKTREEYFINKAGEELHDVTVEQLNVTENGTYSEEGVAYSPVIVNVPAPPIPDNAYLLNEVEGLPSPIATFTDGSALPMPNLKISVEPQQEGSGDPSPENIRPISGWSAVDVNVSGVNVWDEEWEVGNINDGSGENLPQDNVIRSKGYIRVMSGASYYIKCPTSGISRLFLYKGDKSFITHVTIENITNNIYTIPNDCEYIRFRTLAIYGTTYNNDISINYPSTDTEYHAYNGSTITIQLGDTYYGGKLDVVSGVLTVTHVFAQKTWGDFGSKAQIDNFTRGALNLSSYGLGLNTNPRDICNIAPFKANYSSDDCHFYIAVNDIYTSMYLFLPNDTSNDTQIQICYELATPTTIQLTPTAVSSLLGSNNLWADTGNVLEASYFESL